MKNGGLEFELAYNNKIGDFNYYAKVNYTYAHNEIEYMDEAVWPYDYQYRTGHRFGQNFGYVADGLFNSWEEVNNPYRPVYQWNNNKIQPGKFFLCSNVCHKIHFIFIIFIKHIRGKAI